MKKPLLALVGLAVVVTIACLTMPIEPAPLKPRNRYRGLLGPE
jgi:hypothetical protein